MTATPTKKRGPRTSVWTPERIAYSCGELEESGADVVHVRRVRSLDMVVAQTDDGGDVTLGEAAVVGLAVDKRDREFETDQLFRELLRSLTMREQTVIYLYYCEEQTMKAIGQVLNTHESRVSQWVKQIKAQLVQRLSRDEAFAILQR